MACCPQRRPCRHRRARKRWSLPSTHPVLHTASRPLSFLFANPEAEPTRTSVQPGRAATPITPCEEFGYRWDRGTIWLERVIDFAGKAGLGWGFLQFAIPI